MIITTDDVRHRMLGLGPYLDQVTDVDEVIEENIVAAETYFKRNMEIELAPVTITQDGAADDADEFDVIEPAMNWDQSLARRLPKWVMRRRPVISVEELVFKFNDEFQMIDVPATWYRIQNTIGVVNLVPVSSSAAVLTQSGLPFLPLLGQKWPWPVIPQFVFFKYTAGFTDADDCDELADTRRHLAVQAALYTMRDIQDMLPSSVKIDGFSQTFDSVDMRLKRREEEVDRHLKEMKKRYRPPRMVIV
jgi:hypothetical protein